MRLWRKKGDHDVLVVGIFQSPGTGREVLKNLHRARFGRAAAIHASAGRRPRVEEYGVSTIGGAAAVSTVGLAIGAFTLWQQGILANYRPGMLALLLTAFALAGALSGWILVRLFRHHVDETWVARCASTILPGETAVMAEVEAGETARVLVILRDVEAEAPVTFGFHSPPPFSVESTTQPLWDERPSSQRLSENAAHLARSLAVSREARRRGRSFLRRLREVEAALEWANASLTMSAEMHHALTLSAEWLLDNAYLIREQVADLRRSLPQKYYGGLPVITNGPEAGLPRVYHVASEMVSESGCALEPEIIRKFLVAFQAVAPLDIAELWALPLMLRLKLLECLRALAIQVELQERQSEEADFWANRLITGARHSSSRLLRMMEGLVEHHPEPSAHFASELMAHLYDEEATVPLVSQWLEHSLHAPLLEVMQLEHRRQAVQQTALSDVINSCRLIGQIAWREFFEEVSWAQTELGSDPSGVYARQDFETGDRCRGAVEEIAQWSKHSEQEIIRQALALAKAAEDKVARNVGYYLIDAGRLALERATGASVPLAERSRRWLRARATGAYFGSVLVLTVAMVAAPLVFIAGTAPAVTLGLLGLLLLLPASDLAVLAVNYFVTSLLSPQVLPKMSFQKEGIPDDCRTLVVVPTLLTTVAAIQSELERLEIRYLGNTDANLRFALLTDFADAPRQSMPEDAEYIDIIARGIEELNRQYGAGRFFLFHRGRL